MARRGFIGSFAIAALALSSMSTVQIPAGMADTVTRASPTTNQQAPKPAPVNPATNETEKERYERLKGIGRRILRGDKHRRPGERAHRRWRFKRASGKANG